MTIGKQIGQGRTAEVYEIKNNKILKLFKPEVPKQAIDYEYNISKMLYNNGFPVVNTHQLITHNDRLGIVYDRFYGITMLRGVTLKPWTLYKQAKKLAELHFKVHKEIDFDMRSYKDKLIGHIQETHLLDTPCKEKIIAYTNKLPNGNKLCHGDYHPDNVLFNNGQYVVIDWMTATKGDSLADVARTILMLRYVSIPDHTSKVQQYLHRLFTKILLNQYIKNYVKISGATIEDINMWKLPVAAARLIEGIPEEEKKVLIKLIYEEIKKI